MAFVSRVLNRLRSQQFRATQVLILALGLGGYTIGLKIARIIGQRDAPVGIWAGQQVFSDIAFALGWLVLSVALMLLPTSDKARKTSLVFIYAFSTVAVIFTFFHHEVAVRTGSSLTLALIQYLLSAPAEVGVVLGSEVSVGSVLRLLLGLALVLVVPRVLAPPVHRALTRRPRIQTVVERVQTRSSWRLMVPVSVVLLAVLSTWSPATASAQFSRTAVTNLVMTPIERARAIPEIDPNTVTIPDPATTTLTPTSDTDQRNVVIMMLESQRATEVLPETSQPVTPVLDSLRETSLVAEQAYSILPHTSKAITSVHCGSEPPFDNENTEADDNGLAAKCLPELLSEQGYETAFFQSATQHFERRSNLVDNLGFEYFKSVDMMDNTGFSKAGYFGYEDEIMLEPSAEWLSQVQDPFALSYLTVSAHHDYSLPGVEQIDFVDDPTLNEYLNGVHYQDQFVGKVIDQFKELGLYDDTVFVVVGDHGEAFGEHGGRQHDDDLYDEGVRVPLLVHAPGVVDAGTYDEPIQQSTVTPTLLDVLGYDIENSAITTQSLLQPAEGDPVYMTCLVRGDCVASVEDNMKYIHWFGDRQDQVYDLTSDPGETVNLVNDMDPDWLEERRLGVLNWWLTNDVRYSKIRGE